MIYCLVCGLANRDGSRFCNYCGRRVDALVTCPACSAVSPLGSRFCNQCGFGVTGLPGQVVAEAMAPDALRGLAYQPVETLSPPAETPALVGAPAASAEEPFVFPELEDDEPLEAEPATLEELVGEGERALEQPVEAAREMAEPEPLDSFAAGAGAAEWTDGSLAEVNTELAGSEVATEPEEPATDLGLEPATAADLWSA
ncbi:MAG: zinc ribbon domain-containing protein, partial [Chloroflexi bacterium]|nr:zinc ribbon domain-containing protein [Chloroflexota bacterium]